MIISVPFYLSFFNYIVFLQFASGIFEKKISDTGGIEATTLQNYRSLAFFMQRRGTPSGPKCAFM